MMLTLYRKRLLSSVAGRRHLLAANVSSWCLCSEPCCFMCCWGFLPTYKPLGLTCHTKRPPQASGVLLALFEFHTANPDDLTDQKQSGPHQVAHAQILESQVKHQCEDSEKLRLMLKRRDLQ